MIKLYVRSRLDPIYLARQTTDISFTVWRGEAEDLCSGAGTLCMGPGHHA